MADVSKALAPEDPTMAVNRMDQVILILSRGGGVTLQVDNGTTRYQHNFEEARLDECAKCCCFYIDGSDLAGWKDNQVDEGGWLEPSQDDIQSGRVQTLSELIDGDEDTLGWPNYRLTRQKLEGWISNSDPE